MTEPICRDVSAADAALDPCHALISSIRVEGTPVVGADGEKLATVHSLMIDKRSGQVAFAILSFGGILGIGTWARPIEWESLAYDSRMHVYRISLTRAQIAEAPRMRLDEAERLTALSYAERSSDYDGAPHYWST